MLKFILLLNPVYVTFFWSIALSINSRKNQHAKSFLGIFMIFAFVVYFSHFVYFVERFDIYYYFDCIYTLAYLLVYPLYHIYIRLLTVENQFSWKRHFKFFAVPIFLFLFTVLGYLLMSKSEAIFFITQILSRHVEPTGIFLYMAMLFIVGRLVFLSQVIIYFVLSYRLISRNKEKIQDYYSNIDTGDLNWVQFINITLAITSLASILLAILGRDVFLHHPYLLIFPSVVFSSMLFFLGMLGYNQQPVLTEIEFEVHHDKEALPPRDLKKKLELLFENDKVFKNPDLKIWDISSMLGTNRTYVSKIINHEYSRNFCSFVNKYRIEYAKSVLKQNINLTNEQLAEISGFGSVNSFYRAYHTEEDISISQYRKQLASSSEKLSKEKALL